MPVRFRTQDTRASWRRKLNNLFDLEGDARFFAPTPTLIEWADKLNAAHKTMVADDYPIDAEMVFRVSDTRQLWARKLNLMAVAIEAGPVTPEPDPEG